MRTFATVFLFLITISFSSLAAEDFNKQMTFDGFLNEVREQNLSLKIAEAKSDIGSANAIGVKIPAPMVGYMTRSDNSGSADGFEFKQTIPFPSKVSNDYQARKYEAKSEQEIYLGAKSEIFARARLVYFNLWKSQKLKEILKEKIKVIEDHIKLTRAVVRSDSFLKVHLLKAESDLEFLNNELIKSDQQIKEDSALMAEFLNVDPLSFSPSLKEPPLIQIPALLELENPHQLEAKKLKVQSLKKREKEADSEWLPDIYVRYRDIGNTQMMPATREAMVGISLPFIFPWEPYSISQKSAASSRQAEAEYLREKRSIEAQLKILFDKLDSLKKQLDNIEKRLLPLAKKRLAIIRNLTPRDIPTLQEYRETTENFPDLKLEELRIKTQYEEVASAILQYQRGIK